MNRSVAFLAVFCCFLRYGFGQVPNEVLSDPLPLFAADSGRIGIGVMHTSFLRNTEYFNPIEVGRTLFGYQLQPKIFWQPTSTVKLELGVYVRHDFGGKTGFRDVQPTFTLNMVKGSHQLLFGTLKGALSHGMLEPMMDISRFIEHRIENGFQYRYEGKRLWSDLWINWENAIDPGVFDKERFTAGGHQRLRVTPEHAARSVVAYHQLMASHQGGQIDSDTLSPFLMMLNEAAGIRVEQKLNPEALLFADVAALFYQELSNSKFTPKRAGTGVSANLGLKAGNNHFMFTYWEGNHFYAPRGTPLYHSTSLVNPANYSANRRLLFFRWIRNTRVFDSNLEASMRFEPVLDIDKGLLDYSYSLYLVYHFERAFK